MTTKARVFETEDGRYFVEDLGSKNGTFVDGQRVERAELSSGDRIQLGNIVLRFQMKEASGRQIRNSKSEIRKRG